jgi:hypothetical protein
MCQYADELFQTPILRYPLPLKAIVFLSQSAFAPAADFHFLICSFPLTFAATLTENCMALNRSGR